MGTEWMMRGDYIKNCNCAPGCPCDFWAEPTHHECTGMAAMRVRHGRFGSTPLDGTVWAVTYYWPGPLHEGNGTLQPYLSDKTTVAQREGLLTILSGKAGNAWFEVLASVVSKVLEPKFVPIEFEFDLTKRHARVRVAGEFETVTEPIANMATGDKHRIRVEMPEGMEYFRPEIATAKVLKATGAIKFDRPGAHSSLAIVEHRHTGLVRQEIQEVGI
jgi:hypothetical protein